MKCFFNCLYKLGILGFFTFTAVVSNAQSTNPNLTPDQERALREELAQIEQQIKQQQVILDQKQGEATAYQSDIKKLDAQIKQAKLKIRAHEISIQNLGKDIEVKKTTILSLSERIEKSRESLTRILQRTQALDNYSTIEAMLSGQKMSDFFVDIGNYSNIKKDLKVLLGEISSAKTQTEQVKEELSTKRNQEIFTKVNVEEQKKSIEASEKEKQKLLSLNKNEQATYKTSISNNQAKATQIRNALFQLRDSAAIKFGDALTYAKSASQITGVRPAFLLAIIQQESNLGANVGSCYMTNMTTGDGVGKNSGNPFEQVMKAPRDTVPFKSITEALGRDWMKTPVSCPIGSAKYFSGRGFGGGMGPAQFIPSTWVLFSSRVASALGKTSSDPWAPQDALMASSIYLGDLGAGGGTTAERNAACKYYSGRSCTSSTSFYGNQVMSRAATLQANIDILQNS